MVLTKQSLPDQPSLKALILKRGCEARSGTGEFEIFPSITFIKTLEGIPTTTTNIEEFRTLHNSGAGGKFYKWIARRIAWKV